MASPNARRRQRSTRLTVAVALLAISAVLVTVAFLDNVAWFQVFAAFAAVVLGAAATRITHSELMQTRRDAARDRAQQAQEYRELTERRTAESAAFAADMAARISDRETAISALEQDLSKARKQAASVTRKMSAEARRADVAERQLAGSEERAAEAIVRVAELEAELDVLKAELESWKDKRASA